jgi:hypothetical protein
MKPPMFQALIQACFSAAGSASPSSSGPPGLSREIVKQDRAEAARAGTADHDARRILPGRGDAAQE